VVTVAPPIETRFAGEANAFAVALQDRLLQALTIQAGGTDDEVFAGMLLVQNVVEQHEYERKPGASNERREQFADAASHYRDEQERVFEVFRRLRPRRRDDRLVPAPGWR
jgi:hypothetical protein